MELDMGASYSVISGATHMRLWPQKWLMPTTVKLRTYTGEPLVVKGSWMAQFLYGDKEAKLPLLVLTGDGLSLLGQDWLQHPKLHGEDLQQVLQRHEDVLKTD